MKIVKHGVPPDQKEYVAACCKCGSVLEFKAFETVHHFDRRDGDFVSVDCPVCGNMVTSQP